MTTSILPANFQHNQTTHKKRFIILSNFSTNPTLILCSNS